MMRRLRRHRIKTPKATTDITPERTFLLHVSFSDRRFASADFTEFQTLATSAGAEVVDFLCVERDAPTPKFLIGQGKVEEIKAYVAALSIDLILVNYALSATQIKNLQREIGVRVLDRTGLILDIFAQRAKTHEGKLQVELAQLKYHLTHLVREWTHLERQRGGRIGMTGPGEKQIELDRRQIRTKMKRLEQALEKVRSTRTLSRARRAKSGLLTVALVGYTNAGKSTLFNRLTESKVYVKDQLFATLDPTVRQVHVPGVGNIVLVDTVGFIRDLPHDLVAAFRATLEETIHADFLLHVVDASSDERQALMDSVGEVLVQLGADDQPVLEVYNKIDCVPQLSPRVDRDQDGQVKRVWLSAHTGEGMAELETAFKACFASAMLHVTVKLPFSKGKLRAQWFEQKCIMDEKVDDAGENWLLTLLASRTYLSHTCAANQLQLQELIHETHNVLES